MAATKGAGTSVIASTVSTTTSSAIDTSANDLTEVYGSVVQVGTATTAATIQIQVSPDAGTTYYSPTTLLWTAGLAAGTYPFVLWVPTTATKIKVTFTTQVGGTSSTVVCQLNTVTAA
jgi:hypothetical protein